MEKVNFQNAKPILQKEYSIPPHMYDSAFKDYQRKFVYPTNYIISAVVAIIAIIDIVMVATGKSPALIVLAVLCVAVIVVVWLHTSSVRKKLVQDIANEVKDERQTAQFFDDGIIVTIIPKESTNGEQIVIDFSKDNVKILDKNYYFIVCIAKSHFCVIPKKVFDAAEETTLSKTFQKKLGSNYIK